MPAVKKQEQLTDLITYIKGFKHFALIKFEKTKHTTLEQLRKDLKKDNASFKVLKNTLFTKALNKLSQESKILVEVRKQLKNNRETSAFLGLSDEWSKGLKAFFTFAEKDKTLYFKGGLLDETFYPSEQLKKIAQLPPKEQLVAQLIGSMKNPSSKVVYSMKYNMQKLVYVLNYKIKK